eukprot:TRINITY_DN13459_c0_g1_i2.p1 TRINITY_DN13459_c0_g1~~TRINITY_DN13459_c0_g1_i2.p1  ORF type:complete len:102 (+),score=6.27 TRINITY_DN13459_c0_g1_i2:54-359(+)
MPHLGRIPGETSKTMTLEEAVAYIGSYDPDAPVDGTLEWKLQEDALKKIQDNFILRGKLFFGSTVAFILCYTVYIIHDAYSFTMKLESLRPKKAAGPSLNK